MIPLYILGLLRRFGPQHGYQIKKIIAEQLSDFTQIKLPTIYYHLEKMEADGFLAANCEKPGFRPEKTVYTITDKGTEAFRKMLFDLLEFNYRPAFPADGVFYFSDNLEPEIISKNIKIYIEKLKNILVHLEKHGNETMQFIPYEMKLMVNIIFSHHVRHYQAELDWATESYNHLNEKEGLNHG